MKLILVGGFLGSGKTTAISHATKLLVEENTKVAVITNDQGEQQVDSAHLRRQDIPLREVANGCFCCNFTQLEEHVQSLLGSDQPEIIFAESVGSCTDLVATIAKPFTRIRPQFEVVIAVFVDASLLLSLLEGRASFIAENIRYIYKKQLEEADILVINKTDFTGAGDLAKINVVVKNDYPAKIVLYQNSLLRDDIKYWLDTIRQFRPGADRISLDIDYDLYADGEAQLAWFDQGISIQSDGFNATSIAKKIAHYIHSKMLERKLVIGHLKFVIENADWSEKISFTLTGGDDPATLPGPPAYECNMLINARIQMDPEKLKELMDEAIAFSANLYNCRIILHQRASFSPGYPNPTHRIA